MLLTSCPLARTWPHAYSRWDRRWSWFAEIFSRSFWPCRSHYGNSCRLKLEAAQHSARLRSPLLQNVWKLSDFYSRTVFHSTDPLLFSCKWTFWSRRGPICIWSICCLWTSCTFHSTWWTSYSATSTSTISPTCRSTRLHPNRLTTSTLLMHSYYLSGPDRSVPVSSNIFFWIIHHYYANLLQGYWFLVKIRLRFICRFFDTNSHIWEWICLFWEKMIIAWECLVLRVFMTQLVSKFR